MTFARPEWLLAGAVATGLLSAWLRRADRRRARDLARFASARLLAPLTATLSRPRRRAKRAMIGAAIALVFVALAGPQVGERWEETHRRGIDVLIALDVSRSMLARDVAPDRLTRAKLAITDLASRLEGDRLGLIAFAGTAFLQCPLTLDHAAFLESLAALEPGIIEAPGSDLASALDVADQALRSEKRNVKLLVLVSDGEDLGGGAVAAAQRVAREGVRVFTIGVGSAAGELVPASRAAAGADFVKDEAGRYVQSRLDEATLRRIAEATGGFYEPLGQRGEGMDAVAERAIAPIPKEELASRMRRVPVNRSAWPIAAAIGLLAGETLLGERRQARIWRRRRPGDADGGARAAAGAPSPSRSAAALVFALLATAAFAPPVAASPRSARQAFEAGDFERALAEYRAAAAADPDDPRLDFNAGAAAYRAGRFDEASAAFARALRSESPDLQEQSFYNLGNAHFRAGEKSLPADRQQAMRAWQQAIDAYGQALALRPEDRDAEHNRDVARAALEALRQQQEQPAKQKQQSDQQRGDEQQGEPQQRGDEQQGEPQQRGANQTEQARGEQDAQRRDGGAQQPGSSPDGETPAGDAGEKAASAGGGSGDDAERDADAGRRGARPERDPAAGGSTQVPPAGEEQARAEGAQPAAQPPAGASSEPGAAGDGAHGAAEAANPMPDAPPSGVASAARGELSAEEARQLLDSLRGDEQRVPAIAAGAGGSPRPAGGAVRDW